MARAKRIATIDAETDPFKWGRIPQPFIWGFYDGNKFKTFTETADLVSFLRTQDIFVFAHNGGKFDYHYLLPFADPNQQVMLIDGRLSKFKIGKCTFLDSYNILPAPLSAMQKDDIDYNLMEKGIREKHMAEITEYLKGDCIYLFDHIREYRENYGGALTQAGSAFKFWQQYEDIKPPTSNAAYYRRIKPFYFGGRVSPFERGTFHGDFKIYDINSAYPTAMLDEHPFGVEYFTVARVPDKMLPKAFLIVECDSHGALPLRDSKGGVSFPHGRHQFHCTGWEFMAGLNTNTIRNVKIIKAWVFAETRSYKPYVDFFYQQKLAAERAGNKTQRMFAKLFLNSLYGKFGTNGAKHCDYVLKDRDLPPSQRRIMQHEGFDPAHVVGGLQIWQRAIEEAQQTYYNLAVSASITGWVRAYLWESICKVKRPLYCDTDSIICENGDSLPKGDQLGEWDLEGEAVKVAIAGKKLYSCELKNGEYKTACKGVRLTPQEIERVANGETVEYFNHAPSGGIKSARQFVSRKVRKT